MRFPRNVGSRAAIFFALALTFQIETLLVSPRSDSAAWLFIGARQSHGQMPGRDLWDNKLPLIYLVGRLAMATGHPQAFLWLLEASLTAIGALAASAMVCGSSKRSESDKAPNLSAPILTGSLLCVLSGAPSFHAGGYMTEIYAMPLSAVAAWLTLRTLQRPESWRTALGAALLWTIAVSFRLPLALAPLALASYAALVLPPRLTLRAVPFVSMGISLGILVVFCHPMMAGYLTQCIDEAVLWPLGWSRPRVPGPLVLSTPERLYALAKDIAKLGWIHAASTAGLLAAYRTGQRPIVGVAACWYLAALFSAALGWASYAHYLYVALAPACLCAGLLIRCAQGKAAAWVGAALVGITTVVVTVQVSRELWRNKNGEDGDDRTAVVRYIHDHVGPQESVFVWGWSWSADLLYRIDRPPGNRHFLGHTYFDMDASLFDEMVDTLNLSPPAWIVDDRKRDKPSLRGPNPSAWTEGVASLPRLQDFIRSAYRQVASFGRFAILQYRGAGALRQGPDEPDPD